jgi:hypothetical protein
MADVDWLNKDVVYRSEADSNYANVFDRLSNILAEGQRNFMGVDTQRQQDLAAKQLAGQAQAANAAARGLGSSGLGKRAAGQVLEGAEKRSAATSATEDEITRQYGGRNALAGAGQNFSLNEAINNKNYTELAKVFGLLGSQGVSAGTEFSNAMSGSAAGAANRAGVKAFDYLQGWK